MDKKVRSMLIGAAIGALVGAVFAWSIEAESDEDITALKRLGPADAFRLGIGVLTLASQFNSTLRIKKAE